MKTRILVSLRCSLVGLLVAVGSPSQAAPIPVANFSFEEPAPAAGGYGYLKPDWPGRHGDDSVQNAASFTEYIVGFAAQGNQHLGLSDGTYHFQNTGVSFQANKRYTLTVALGNRPGYDEEVSGWGLTNVTPPTDNSESFASLVAGDSLLTQTLQQGEADVLTAESTFMDATSMVFETDANPPSGLIHIVIGSYGTGRSHFDHIRLEVEDLGGGNPGGGQQGLDAPEPVGAYLNGVFPTTAPGSATGWTTVNAFPNLTFTDGLWLTSYPGTNDLVVVEKTGRIYRFDNNPAVTPAQMTEMLDWRSETETSEDQGFYSLIYHPTFGQATVPDPADMTGVNQIANPNRGYVYVCYNHHANAGVDDNDRTYWRLTRFNIPDGSSVIDPNSETILISQYDPNRWHNGGALFFGPKGCLYATSGDGGGGGDPFDYSQDLTFGFFGGVYRLDVDNDMYPTGHPEDKVSSHAIRRQPQGDEPTGWPASFSANYQIPDDNPWQDPSGNTMEEFFALGLRSPHTMHLDEQTGQVWVGDVGQGTREELGMFRVDASNFPTASNGLNHQWAYREGFTGGPKATPQNIIGVDTVPIHDYPRGTGNCIIGGFVYRGSEHASTLGGKVLYGDHGRGRIWSLEYVEGQAPVIEELVPDFRTGNKAGLGNFCRDANGEVYLMDLAGTDTGGSVIRKLQSSGVSTEPPALLSQTGAFTDTANLVEADFLLPYEVANPLWSDHAKKKRWIAVPNDGTHNTSAERISFDEKDNWSFPAGTVIVKHFELPLDESDPSVTTRLETRFLICTADGGKYGVTYRWLPDQSDAVLLTSGETGTYTVSQAGGGTRTQTWQFPSRADCLLCHNNESGQALGVRTSQLNFIINYEATGRDANQLATWDDLGMFDVSLGVAAIENFLKSEPLLDLTVPIEHRVRSYLDSNCSHCHRPGALGGTFDARLHTPLSAQNIVNTALERDFDLGPDDAIIKPMDPAMSAIHARMNAAQPDPAAMPLIAKNEVDTVAVQVVADWINGLVDSEFDETGGTTGRYVRFTSLSEQNGNPWAAIAELNVLDGNGAVIAQNSITLDSFDSEETTGEFAPASHILDGDPATFWHTTWSTPDPDPNHPHWVILDLGSIRSVGGFTHLTRQAGGNGRILGWTFEISDNKTSWTQLGSGSFAAQTDVHVWDELSGTRAVRTALGGPSGSVTGDFEVNLYLDFEVDDLDSSDFAVTGGTIADLKGSGHYYTATVTPQAATVSVNLPEDALAGPSGEGNFASNTISVTFGSNNSPTLDNPVVDFSVVENASDSVLDLANVFSDPDAGDTLTLTVEGNTDSSLVTTSLVGEQLTLSYAANTTGSSTLTIRATDGAGDFVEDSFVVTVTPGNQPPVVGDFAFSVDENSAGGTPVGTVTATDPDAGDVLSFAISAGNTGGAFAIGNASGEITVAGPLDFESLSQYTLTVVVSDDGSPALSDTSSVTIDINDVVELAPPLIASGASSNMTADSADVGFSISDTGGENPLVNLYYGTSDGGSNPGSWSNSATLGSYGVGSYVTGLSGLSDDTLYHYNFRASNSAGEAWGSSNSFTTPALSSPKLVHTTLSGVGNGSWTSVNLGQSYVSPVIIATPIYASGTAIPMVTRIRNISGGNFEIKIDRTDGLTTAVSCDVSIVAVEEGVYTLAEDGVKMEAVTYTSTLTAENNNWTADVRSYQNSYTSPVVLGQVMSTNDSDWSVFWCQGSSRNSPPNSSNLRMGKTVCEDDDNTRADETIGYIVIEAGTGTLDGVAYTAGLGADTVRGYGNNSTGYNYPISGLSTASSAAISQAGMDGGNGGWSTFVGSSPITPSLLRVVIDEDQARDSERKHTTEQVGYLIFE